MNNPDQGQSPPLRVRPLRYPIAPQALANWWNFDMKRKGAADGGTQFTFRYLGSTCTNCGTPIETLLHAIIKPGPESATIARAWIEFDEDDEGHPRMCEFNARGKALVEELGQPASFCGRTLEAAIAGLTEINPAGCFCAPAMINHKWRQMLCTIHYGLSQEKG